MSTEALNIAGVTLVEQRPTFDPNVEYWFADCNGRLGEVYLVSADLQSRIQSLPNLIGFTQCQVMKLDASQIAIVMPGIIEIPVSTMRSKLGITACVGIAWHLADLLSLLHQSGRAHNLLHADKMGINDQGELEIRPALGLLLSADPDPKATAIATDSWQMRSIIQQLGIQERLDPLFALLTRGLQEDVARLRLQPATAIRQSISAVLARHVEWEEAFVKQMGKSWALNQRNIDESVILPHRLQEVRPTFSKASRKNRTRDVAESIDLWGNLFSSSSVDESSSTQALLLEALRQRKKTTELIGNSSESPLNVLSPREEFQFDEPTERLEISIQGISSIQVPVQKPSGSDNGLRSIQEVGFTEDQDSMLPESEHESRPMTGIVEEIPSDLQALHQQRRRTVAIESSKTIEDIGLSKSFLPPTEIVIDVIDEIPLQSIVEDLSMVNTVETAMSELQAVVRSEDDVIEDDLVSDMDLRLNNLDLESRMEVESQIEVESEVIDIVVDLDDESLLSDALEDAEHLDDAVQSPEIPLDNLEIVSVDYQELSATESIVSEESLLKEVNLFTDDVEYTEVIAQEQVTEPQSTMLSPSEVIADGHHMENIVETSILPETNIVEEDRKVESFAVDEANEVLVEIEQVETGALSFQEESEQTVSKEAVDPQLPDKSPVSIQNMSLVSIVEGEDSEEEVVTLEEVDEVGIDIAFLMDDEPEPVSLESFDAVFETESEVQRPLETVESPAVNLFAVKEEADGFIDSLEASQMIPEVELDVEEPLADIEFPSIEEVHSQDMSFTGSVDDLFDEPSVTSRPRTIAPVFEERPIASEPFVSEPIISKSSVSVAAKQEPKWTGSTAFDNLADEENALGDEKYAHAQVELGDVDAVLGESIRDFSEQERQGSPWGLLLIITIVAIFGIGYLLNPQATSSEAPVTESTVEVAIDNPVDSLQVQISTDPPQGRIYIDNVELGVSPLQWEPTEADVFMMCVDWGSNPICRRVSNTDLQTDYIFTRELTP